ncbi:DUF2802 domain-containing protein [Halanaerobacter jeridensis]|uniref:Nuclease with TOPRIM domain n=1 Tax=Halanaerobacter jeridensis TaxID=706427 RepID=A0A939BNF0_9FIRM|nr:DUF2802 domain-containing protein [Halanaerobacter jeridensis]MBM7555367.1 putative nuclease with TOPRIM domain [Halanaerobacter jeridensis]
MEYGLFSLGILIVVISLFISYKQNNNSQDDYYLQSELLSEIRAVKDELEDKLDNIEGENFQQVFDQQREQNNANQNLNSTLDNIEDRIIELEEKIDRLESKMNYSLSNAVSSAANETQNKEEQAEVQEHQAYQKIKELVEQGLSLAEVAQKLDMGTREVRLIWKFNSRGEG